MASSAKWLLDGVEREVPEIDRACAWAWVHGSEYRGKGLLAEMNEARELLGRPIEVPQTMEDLFRELKAAAEPK
jgi:hypothetical protein